MHQHQLISLPLQKKFCLALSLCLFAALSPSAQAKIGMTTGDYISHAPAKLKLAKQTPGALIYTVLIGENELKVSSGFAAGATISLRDGIVSGQSIAIRIGSDMHTGKVLAAAHILDFVYEAIGKSINGMNKPAMEEELLKYKAAVAQAMAGRAQELRYKGFNYNIKITSNQQGSVMAFILPGPPPSQGKKPAVPAKTR